MYNSDNMGFYNMPVARYTYKYARSGKEWRTSVGGFTGKANINMYGRNNSCLPNNRFIIYETLGK